MSNSPSTQQTSPVAAFFDLLKRRMVVALVTGIAIGVLVLAWFLSVTPLYQADAKLVVDQSRRAVDFSPSGSDREDRYSLMNTQRDLIVSYPVLAATVQAAQLEKKNIYARDPISVLEGRLKAISNKDSWMIDLTMRDESPRVAEQILVTAIEQYQAHERRRHQQVTEGGVALLRTQAESAKNELTRARDEEQQLRIELGIVRSDPERNPITERLTQLEVRLLAAERDLAQAEVVQATLIAADLAATPDLHLQSLVQVPEIRREVLVQSQYQSLAELGDQRRLLLKDFLETNPEVVQLDSRIATSRDRLESSISVVRAGIAHQRAALVSQRDELRTAIAAARNELSALRRSLGKLQLKSEEAATRERIFQTLINRQHEEEASSLLVGQVVTIAEEPHAGSMPVNIRRSMSFIASIMLGILGAIGAALVAETFDRRIRDADSVTELTDLPTLGMIPHAEGLPLLGRRDERTADRRWQGVEEAFRMMRSTLQLSAASGDATRIIAITSPSSGEGRSTVVARLGMSLAASGRGVLVVDADLRMPGLHRHLGMPDGLPGLAELLAGQADIAPIPTSWPRLHLLPAGTPNDHSAEQLQSPFFHERLSDFTETFDYILFDCPPLEFSEALEIGALADDILLVIRDRFTSKQALRLSQTRLGRLRGKVLGLIINDDRTTALQTRAKDDRGVVPPQTSPLGSGLLYKRQPTQIIEPTTEATAAIENKPG